MKYDFGWECFTQGELHLQVQHSPHFQFTWFAIRKWYLAGAHRIERNIWLWTFSRESLNQRFNLLAGLEKTIPAPAINSNHKLNTYSIDVINVMLGAGCLTFGRPSINIDNTSGDFLIADMEIRCHENIPAWLACLPNTPHRRDKGTEPDPKMERHPIEVFPTTAIFRNQFSLPYSIELKSANRHLADPIRALAHPITTWWDHEPIERLRKKFDFSIIPYYVIVVNSIVYRINPI